MNIPSISQFHKTKTLSRTGSMSSLTSSKSYTTQESHNIVIGNMVEKKKEKEKGLEIRFPRRLWSEFIDQLN